jgi:hypothetical protein
MRHKLKELTLAILFSLTITTCVAVVGVGGIAWLYASAFAQKNRVIKVEDTTRYLGCNVPIMIDGSKGYIDRAQVERTLKQYEKECY